MGNLIGNNILDKAATALWTPWKGGESTGGKIGRTIGSAALAVVTLGAPHLILGSLELLQIGGRGVGNLIGRGRRQGDMTKEQQEGADRVGDAASQGLQEQKPAPAPAAAAAAAAASEPVPPTNVVNRDMLTRSLNNFNANTNKIIKIEVLRPIALFNNEALREGLTEEDKQFLLDHGNHLLEALRTKYEKNDLPTSYTKTNFEEELLAPIEKALKNLRPTLSDPAPAAAEAALNGPPSQYGGAEAAADLAAIVDELSATSSSSDSTGSVRSAGSEMKLSKEDEIAAIEQERERTKDWLEQLRADRDDPATENERTSDEWTRAIRDAEEKLLALDERLEGLKS